MFSIATQKTSPDICLPKSFILHIRPAVDVILVIHTTVGGVSVSYCAHMGLRNLVDSSSTRLSALLCTPLY